MIKGVNRCSLFLFQIILFRHLCISMACFMSCSIAFVFLTTMIYMTMQTSYNQSTPFRQFSESLTETQQKRFETIVNERRNIHYQGYAIGFVLSLLLIFTNRQQTKKWSRKCIVCMVVAITFTINYFYYILSPKSDYMILHLNTQEQREKWLEVYKFMQKNYHQGFLLGIISVMLFGYGLW